MFNVYKDLQKSYLNVYEKFNNTNVNGETNKKNTINIGAKTSLVSKKIITYANKLSNTVQENAEKLNTFVTKHTIIGELQKENENFKNLLQSDQLKTQNKLLSNCLPWEGMPDVDVAKKQILLLSLDERNFLDDSPITIENNIDITNVAQKLLLIDSNLQKMRYNLVPKKISEEKFWNNYFYRISLIKKILSNNNKKIVEKKQSLNLSNEKNQIISYENYETDKKTQNNNISNNLSADEDWDKELLNDFNGFELVENKGFNQSSEAEWDEEIKALLETEALNIQNQK